MVPASCVGSCVSKRTKLHIGHIGQMTVLTAFEIPKSASGPLRCWRDPCGTCPRSRFLDNFKFGGPLIHNHRSAFLKLLFLTTNSQFIRRLFFILILTSSVQLRMFSSTSGNVVVPAQVPLSVTGC